MSVEIPIDTKYLPTNRASGRTTRDDEEYGRRMLWICRNEEENKMEEIIGKIWVYRMNALAVLIVGIGLLCFHKMIGSILNYEVLVPCICLVGMAVYCNVVCWIYTSWIQLPISFSFHSPKHLNFRLWLHSSRHPCMCALFYSTSGKILRSLYCLKCPLP